MALTRPGTKSAPLRVTLIAAALIIAAVFGAGVGLVWQSSGFADGDDQAEAEPTDAPESAET